LLHWTAPQKLRVSREASSQSVGDSVIVVYFYASGFPWLNGSNGVRDLNQESDTFIQP
jgi:hypothetical protein